MFRLSMDTSSFQSKEYEILQFLFTLVYFKGDENRIGTFRLKFPIFDEGSNICMTSLINVFLVWNSSRSFCITSRPFRSLTSCGQFVLSIDLLILSVFIVFSSAIVDSDVLFLIVLRSGKLIDNWEFCKISVLI